MGSWVNLDYNWDQPCATFNISMHDLLLSPELGELRHVINELRNKPYDNTQANYLETKLLEFVEYKRPDLTGCILYAMSFTPHPPRLQVTVSHPNLPRTSPGMMPTEQDL